MKNNKSQKINSILDPPEELVSIQIAVVPQPVCAVPFLLHLLLRLHFFLLASSCLPAL